MFIFSKFVFCRIDRLFVFNIRVGFFALHCIVLYCLECIFRIYETSLFYNWFISLFSPIFLSTSLANKQINHSKYIQYPSYTIPLLSYKSPAFLVVHSTPHYFPPHTYFILQAILHDSINNYISCPFPLSPLSSFFNAEFTRNR